MKLVDDWKQAWKWISIWCLALTGAVSATWDSLPLEWRTVLLENSSVSIIFKAISILSAIGIIGRLVKQGKDDAANN